MSNDLILYQSVISDIRDIITEGRNSAYSAASAAMIMTYWNIGKRIVEQEQSGEDRAEYGRRLISSLSDELTKEFGKGFSARNLRNFRKFYTLFPDDKIWQTRLPNLTWSHFSCLLRVADENARIWYLNEAAEENWSARTLDRNIGTQYYYRLLHAPKKEAVIAEMQDKTKAYQKSGIDLIKSPVVAEFLGFKNEDTFLESDLEAAILSHIRDFLMEMGRGFAFVSRQQHIITETEDYYIDLVFYNIELKCYVLIDLKMGKITHQDVGQIDMYVKMYDDLKCKDGDNPTIGILLCAETDEDIARYSVLHDNERLFMSKYLTYLPSKEQLRTEIERQKEIFYLQHPKLQEEKE
jgi:predicted nuclease of restriction endonuclease-like (RecB) superfamily